MAFRAGIYPAAISLFLLWRTRAALQGARELLERRFRVVGKQSRGQTRDASIRVEKFAGKIRERLRVPFHRGEVAAGDGAGPGRARADPLQIIQRLPR